MRSAEGISFIAEGIQWPLLPGKKGRMERSSTGTATAILSAALRAHGSTGAVKMADELLTVSGGKWRFGYQKYMVELTRLMAEATTDVVNNMGRAGLVAAQSKFVFLRNGETLSLQVAMDSPMFTYETGHVVGAGNNSPSAPVSVPYNKQSYSPEVVPELLKTFVRNGDMEDSVRAGVSSVLSMDKRVFEDLSDLYVVLIGATSEMGPLDFLLEHGANVIALARQGEKKWNKLIEKARNSRGQLYFPTTDAASANMGAFAGADALKHTPEIAQWLSQLLPGKKFLIHSLIYLDGEKYVRASMAMDAIVEKVTAARKKVKPGLLYIGTPSSAHLVPSSCKTRADEFFHRAPLWQKALFFFGLLKRNKYLELQNQNGYVVVDALSGVQGPNYALAKFLQNWRALLARTEEGQFVSVNIAPPAMTASVMHAPKIAAAAPFLPLFKPNMMYYPDTVSALLSIMLLADIRNEKSLSHPGTPLVHPMQLVAEQAWHGGSWSAPFTSDSTGVAAYLCHLCKKATPIFVIALVGTVVYLALRH
jgi:hypothetical protein